jgi:hypothetical protein
MSVVDAAVNVDDMDLPLGSSISLSEISCSVLNLLLTAKVSPGDDDLTHRLDLPGDRK